MNHDFSRLPSRRRMLKNCAAGFGSLAMAAMLADESNARAADSSTENRGNPLAPKVPHFAPRAKRVIYLFMAGGPSHMDTFDYKPLLQRDDGKPLPFEKPRVQFAETGKLLGSPWKFKQYGESGSWVSELFPNVAGCVDDLCFLHSLHGSNAAHGGAFLKMHTGSDNFVRPSMGSWLTYGLGTENQNLPGFITICPTLSHGGNKNWGSAFLPASFQGTPIGNASIPADKARVSYIKNTHVSPKLQRIQLDMLAEMNRDQIAREGADAALEGRLESFELAFRMQTEMPEIEDISRESRATLQAYGLDDPVTANFGRQCLLARRFSERGVRFIQISHSDAFVQWDQHSELKKGHEKNAREVDKPIAALLKDLKARGLLDDTLVLWGGEFGRTPTAQGKDGRDHNPDGFTMWMAGGGVKPGFHYGATDDYGYFAVQQKMHVHDLHATILHLMGLNHEKLTYRYAGRDFRLTDVAGQVAHEIMA
ncbi:MAG: sulfatase [Planctomycetes bacterium SCN 63-9]|nr:MAG: sulfatase [Planctomycetes bacterium SCN 63-9]